jgi:hypothetical protein
MGTIRTEQTRLLQENGTENIEFFVYDKDGVAKTTLKQTKDVLKQVPSTITPINSDLVAEYISRPNLCESHLLIIISRSLSVQVVCHSGNLINELMKAHVLIFAN